MLSVTQLGTPYTDADGRVRRYGTAYLRMQHQAAYGRWEMRAKLPTDVGVSQGVWPAFWHRAVGGAGEIDTMESWGCPAIRAGKTESSSTFTVHESTSGGGSSLGTTCEQAIGTAHPWDTASQFHTWALERTPTYIRGYMDDQLVRELTPTSHPWAFGAGFYSGATPLPLDTRLCVQMGDTYWSPDPQPGADLVLPRQFVIDYVRYWSMP